MEEIFKQIYYYLQITPNWVLLMILTIYFISLNFLFISIIKKQLENLHNIINMEKANNVCLILKFSTYLIYIVAIIGFLIIIRGIDSLIFSIPSYLILIIFWNSIKGSITLYDHCITLKFMPELYSDKKEPTFILWTITKNHLNNTFYVQYLLSNKNILI